jgi:uncharacterized membrane protein (DUF4010 family)
LTLAIETLAVRLAVALGIGLLIGAERERRKGTGPDRAPAGIRTFALAALAGGLSLAFGGEAVLVMSGLVVGALAVIAYLRSRRADPGLTTEVALLTTFLLGALAVREPALAAGLAATVAVLLAVRHRLHRFVRTVLTEQELHDALLFAAAALVILPLTPDRGVGPYGALNPRTLWKLVILVMAISASGYAALRLLGPRAGLPLSGLASGFVSSVATIGAMGQRAAKEPGLRPAAAAGAVLSTVATVVQMALVLLATSRPTLDALGRPLLLAGLAAGVYGLAFTLRLARVPTQARVARGRAFDLKASVLFALTVSAVLLASAAVNQFFGERGVWLAAAVAGFADTHAAAISVASLVAAGKLSAAEAVVPILAAMTANTVTKAAVAAAAGGRRFALQTIPGLVLVMGAAWAPTRLAPVGSFGANASWKEKVSASILAVDEDTRRDGWFEGRDRGASIRFAARGPRLDWRAGGADRHARVVQRRSAGGLPETRGADPRGRGPAAAGRRPPRAIPGGRAPRRSAHTGDDLAGSGPHEGGSRGRRQRRARHVERVGSGRRRPEARLRLAPARHGGPAAAAAPSVVSFGGSVAAAPASRRAS